jgi:hypothetical protein
MQATVEHKRQSPLAAVIEVPNDLLSHIRIVNYSIPLNSANLRDLVLHSFYVFLIYICQLHM